MTFYNDTVFPHDISYNSEGAEVFATEVNVADSGYEQRIGAWDQPLMEYNVAYGVRTLEQLHALKTLFRVVRGKSHGFRFRDPIDYTSSFATGEEARSPDPITPFDQIIGTGDGNNRQFQLIKKYETAEGDSIVRPIFKPENGTVTIASNGRVYPSTSFSVDYETGVVTTGSAVTETVGGTVDMSGPIGGGGRYRNITWTDGSSLTELRVGDYLDVSGFDNLANRILWTHSMVVNYINNTTKLLTVYQVDGPDVSVGIPETKVGAIVSLTSAPFPVPNAIITAGFKFHIPVRFDTDRLPISMQSYGVGSASDVKLVELRGGC
jgi:uncharacterized protein (TIGR02217 family)